MSEQLLQTWQSLTPDQQQALFPFLIEEAQVLISGVGWESEEDADTITCSRQTEDLP